MTLRDKIAQLVVIPCFGESPSLRSAAFRDFAHAVRDLHVGGIIVINRVISGSVRNAEPYAMAAFLNRMQKLAKTPLVVGGDFERGASMRVAGTAKFPHLMAYGAAHDPQLVRQLGGATAKEARALGVQWVFAPDADVNNNPDNPIINIRSFGENPQDVAGNVKAFIAGAQSDPTARVLVTVKHFPGHGDTNVDSHMGLPLLAADRARIETTEFVPFKAAIEAGVDAVMTAHMAAPALGATDEPSTISKAVLTGMLRDSLHFRGLIVTDAMDMGGLVRQFPGGEAAVRAVEAGADVLLMPPNPEAAISAIAAAVRSGRISEKRVNDSALRILQAKARVGLWKSKLVDLESVNDVLASEDLAQQAQEAADRAITLLKDSKNSIPITPSTNACFFILAEGRYGQQGRRMLEEIRSRSKTAKALLFDPLMPPAEIERLATEQAAGCETKVVAAFATVGAYRGDVALNPAYAGIMKQLASHQSPLVMVALGNPYLLRSYPDVSAYMATFSPVTTSEVAAVKALFGEISIAGKSPVSIPGFAAVGEGMSVPKRHFETRLER